MRTVKELADSFKVSRQTIYNAIAKDDIKKYIFKQDNLTLIDENGVELLTALFDKEKNTIQPEDFQAEIQDSVQVESADSKSADSSDFWREQLSNKDKQISDLSDKFNDLFEQLKEKDNQLKEKDKQIETILNQFGEKDNQINTAQRLLENQQKLQATQMITDGEEKISFWKKIFKKKDFQE